MVRGIQGPPQGFEIRFLPRPVPADAVRDALDCIPDYADRALASELPHGPSHECLLCADARAALGYLPIPPALERAARGMRERDAGIARIGTASGIACGGAA